MLLLLSAPVLILLIFASHVDSESTECEGNQHEPWSYGGRNGPSNWGKTYPTCNGQNQSPINIDTSEADEDESLKPIDFVNYGQPIILGKVENNGHTVQLTPKDSVSRKIQHGGLSDVYNLTQFHFHWGSIGGGHGSEHRINGRAYEMEMHLVHVNSKNQIAAVGIFLEESIINNPSLRSLVKAVKSFKYKGDSADLDSPVNLKSILPENSGAYYRYSGSLTTPGCDEVVTWYVLAEPIPIGVTQIQAFRRQMSTLKSAGVQNQCSLSNNYRPIQPLNGRPVTSSKEVWRR